MFSFISTAFKGHYDVVRLTMFAPDETGQNRENVAVSPREYIISLHITLMAVGREGKKIMSNRLSKCQLFLQVQHIALANDVERHL